MVMPGEKIFSLTAKSDSWLKLSIAIYFVSLLFTSFYVNNNFNGPSGFSILITGWLGISLGVANFTWLANPLLFVSWAFLFMEVRKTAFFASMIAFMLGVLFLFSPRVILDQIGKIAFVTDYRAGYWLWLASIVCALIGSTRINPAANDVNHPENDEA